MDSFSADQDTQKQVTDQFTFKVGEKEYSTQSAATKIENQDSHIAKIEAENAALRTKMETSLTDNDVQAKIDAALQKLQPATSQENQTTVQTSGVSEEQIGEIAQQKLASYMEAKQTEEANASAAQVAQDTFNSTKNELVQMYGEKTEEALNAKATDLGCSMQDLIQMAKNPVQSKLLLKEMSIKPSSTEATPSGSINTTSFNRGTPEKHVESWSSVTSSDISAALEKAGATFKPNEHIQY